jgi:CHAD domain-containing protein
MQTDQERSRKLIRDLNSILGGVARRPEPERVHRLRTTIRRIDALMDLVLPESERDPKLTKRLEKLRRRAGKVRDIDVQLSLLRGLKIGRDSERKAQLMMSLTEQREKREKRLLDALGDSRIAKVRKRVKRLAGVVSPPQTAATASSNGRRPKRVATPLQRALERFAEVSSRYATLNQANLHQYRLACKEARYIAELAPDDSNKEFVLTEFKRIQDAVGEWHDWTELCSRAETIINGEGHSALLSAMRNIAGARFIEAQRVTAQARAELLEIARKLKSTAAKAEEQASPPQRRPAGFRPRQPSQAAIA